MYEPTYLPLLPRHLFVRRVTRHLLVGAAVLLGVLGIGMAGYMYFAHFSAVAAFLNSAMLVGGMGPMGELPNDGAKIFAGIYALFAGLVFMAVAGVLVAPFAHRLLHRLHLQKN